MTTRKSTECPPKLILQIDVKQCDIDDGKCGSVTQCMEKLAIERKLREYRSGVNHHTRVDAGHIKFNYDGYRYVADTPAKARRALKQFDKELEARRKARLTGTDFVSAVQPHSYSIIAMQGRKIEARTQERRSQINAARALRTAAGQKPKRYSLHERVVGYT